MRRQMDIFCPADIPLKKFENAGEFHPKIVNNNNIGIVFF
jgi:hypothetical protein